MNWLRIGSHYINLAQVIEIIADAQRIDYAKPWQDPGREMESAVVFVCASAVSNGDNYNVNYEIVFFEEEREGALSWLAHLEGENL